MAGLRAWMTGQTQLLSRWLWMIVNKVKLIADGCQFWSHFLLGAGGSHVESNSTKAGVFITCGFRHHMARVIVITLPSGLLLFLTSLLVVNHLLLSFFVRGITYLWSLVLLCEHLQLIMCTRLAPNFQMWSHISSQSSASRIPWRTGCLYALKC